MIVAAALLVAACGSGDSKGSGGPGGRGPTTVGYVVVQQGSAPLQQVLPGRVAAYQIAEVRPQVNGVILRRLFREGSIVRQGQTLYQIDPSMYQAQAAQAAASLESARANAEAASALAARYKPLVDLQAVARQDYTNAVAQARMANAAIAQNAANLRAAQVNLRWTRVPAPITGQIGVSNFTEGALVTTGQTAPLTTITRLDPIYVDIQQSSADLLRLREQTLAGQITNDRAPVRLKLETGSMYPLVGTLSFADVTVDPDTGSQTIRAVFPNPQHLLLPGMFVRGQLSQGVQSRGILVPQRAVSRDERGRPTVIVVGKNNMAELRVIQADRTVGDNWFVTGGLKPGDKVIVDAGPMLRPGVPVKPQLSTGN